MKAPVHIKPLVREQYIFFLLMLHMLCSLVNKGISVLSEGILSLILVDFGLRLGDNVNSKPPITLLRLRFLPMSASWQLSNDFPNSS
jgi:hypothetical protein